MSKYLVFSDMIFADRGCLLAALAELGFGEDRVEQGERLSLYGYRGDRRPETADVVIRRKHIDAAANDVGFVRQGGGYVPIVSEYDQGAFMQGRFLTRLKVAYGEAAARRIAERVRGSVQRRVEGGKIVITVRCP